MIVRMVTETKKLTILVDADMHRALLRKVGRGNIGRFLTEAAKPLLSTHASLRKGYAAMAQDKLREKEAHAWTEGLVRDSYAEAEE